MFSRDYVVEATHNGNEWKKVEELLFVPKNLPKSVWDKIRAHKYRAYRIKRKRDGQVVEHEILRRT